jgi:hypothetical protein
MVIAPIRLLDLGIGDAGQLALSVEEVAPRGNTVNRASIDAKPQAPEIVVMHLMEGIGIALDDEGGTGPFVLRQRRHCQRREPASRSEIEVLFDRLPDRR